ncbi:MAG: hypothetical protein ACOWWH_01360 [Eubacteriaceae bacterium]
MGLNILDTTLRDGSNAINFNFDENLTKIVLENLEKAGVDWIEMGHGMGLGASKKCGKSALLSDIEYMELANENLAKAKYGFIISKKFGTKQDIKEAAERGVNFIRIAANITEVEEIEDYTKFAIDQGLTVLIALMKAYAIKPNTKEYHKILKEIDKWNIKWATLMDSAGNMTPEDVKDYIIQARLCSNVKLGFHAHNNLQLGIANTMAAIQSGVISVDASVGGLGRSSGNAPTEILALLLEKYELGKLLDYKILSNLNDEYIFPLIRGENRFSSSALTFGFAGFHSSFFPLIEKELKKNPSLDYRDLIIELSRKEQVNVTENLINETAMDLLRKNEK